MVGDDIDELVIGEELGRPKCKFIDLEKLNETPMVHKLYNINVRGFKNSLSEMEEFLNSLKNVQHARAITLTEVFDVDHTEKNNYLNSHTLVSKCRKGNAKRGGAGILVADECQFSIPDLKTSFREGFFETITVIIKESKSIMKQTTKVCT